MKRLGLFAATVLAVAGGTALAAVFSASQKQLAIGTTFDVEGEGFAKPVSAWLDVSGKRVPLKALKGATDTHFTAQLRNLAKRAAGDCVLKVRAKGTKIPSTLAGFTIEIPDAEGAIPGSAPAGADVEIVGAFFGTKKGHVLVGGRKAKVTQWGPGSIHFTVPQGLPQGLVFVDVENKVGVSLTRPVLNIE